MIDTDGMIDLAVEDILSAQGDAVRDDWLDMLFHREQLADPTTVGSAIMATQPLTALTIRRKAATGSGTPDLPRINTGEMMSQIQAVMASGAVEVGVFGTREDVAVFQQAKRPFIGISERAASRMDEILNRKGEELAIQIADLLSGGMTVKNSL